MISHEVRAEVFEMSAAEFMSSDSWERPDAVVSSAKQKAHDRFFLDTPDGGWLPEGRIAHEVHLATSAFVGETPLGRQVFLVAPGERTRPRNQKNIPLDAHFAYEFALKRELLRAVQNAEDGHLITHEEAIRQAGGMDPAAALDALEASHRASADTRNSWDPSRHQNVIRDGALIAAQATHMAIPAGMVGAGIALAARGKDGYGRRFRNVGRLMYMTSAGITAGSLALSACTGVQGLPPQEVAVAPTMPEQFNPTVDQARQAVASWMGMRVPLAEGEFGVFPTQAIFEVDPTDSTGQTLKTLSLLNADRRTTNPDLRYAMGLALVPSEKTGEAVELPFLVQLGKNGEALMLGMFLDPEQSTKDVGVFRLNIIKDGQIRPVTQEVVVTKVADGVIVQLRDISDPNNIVIYNLVSTLKDSSVPPQQSVVPTQIVGNNWIEKVVAFMSGAGSVQAAEPAIPQEQLASATPLPSPEPSATPPPTEVAPTSCKDIPSIQPVADKFLQEKGYANWGEVIAANGITKDDIKTSYSTQVVSFRQAIIVDDYDIPVSIPGFEGKAQCVVFAVPTSLTEVKLFPVIISATRDDGTESGSIIVDNPSAYGTFLPGDVDKWIKDHRGRAVQVTVYVFGTSIKDFTFQGFLDVDVVDRSILGPFFEYALRGESGLSLPNVWDMIEQMNGDEPGLMLKMISGVPDDF